MAIDRFTFFGLALALLGWVILAADLALGPVLLRDSGLAASAALRPDIVPLAQTTIFSGFALALIGVLRAGFGALHRFFDAVLDRASTPRIMPADIEASDADPVVPAVEHAPQRPLDPRGFSGRTAKGHNYVILASGAVEVETLLGTRVFASMHEAKDYIR